MSYSGIITIVVGLFLTVNAQQPLYNDGDFVTSLFAPMLVPEPPYTLDQVNAILSLAPVDNGTLIPRNLPCISIHKGQDVGYRLVTTQLSGYAFLPSNSLCACNNCFRIMPCCGNIRNADGTITPCYTPIPCRTNGTCLRNYECFGASGASDISSIADLNSAANTDLNTVVPLVIPCFKFSPAVPGSNGFTIKAITTGTGFTVSRCNSTVPTACLSLQSCCAGLGRRCFTATPCCVPKDGVSGPNCLSITRCDTPTSN